MTHREWVWHDRFVSEDGFGLTVKPVVITKVHVKYIHKFNILIFVCGLFIRIYTVIRLRRNAEMGFWARIELEVQWTCDLNVIIFLLFPCSMGPVIWFGRQRAFPLNSFSSSSETEMIQAIVYKRRVILSTINPSNKVWRFNKFSSQSFFSTRRPKTQRRKV